MHNFERIFLRKELASAVKTIEQATDCLKTQILFFAKLSSVEHIHENFLNPDTFANVMCQRHSKKTAELASIQQKLLSGTGSAMQLLET